MSRLDDFSVEQIEGMTLDVYDSLGYVDQAMVAAHYPTVFSRLMDERRAAQEAATKAHNAAIDLYNQTPINRLQPRKNAAQATQKPHKPLRQVRLDDMDIEAIQGLSAQDFERLSYADAVRLFREYPETYHRIISEQKAAEQAKRAEWMRKYG